MTRLNHCAPALALTWLTLATTVLGDEAPARDYPVRPVPFTDVKVEGGFWGPRFQTNRDVTLWYDFQKCEETNRIANFARAGGLEEGPFEGIFFNDSDVFKVMEGAAYLLAQKDDPKLDAYLDDLIAKIAAAQEDDGYLYTARTLGATNNGTGPERWSNLGSSHELYNVGHMYEAAVAHYLATGKRTFLDVAIKNADLIARVFGPGRTSAMTCRAMRRSRWAWSGSTVPPATRSISTWPSSSSTCAGGRTCEAGFTANTPRTRPRSSSRARPSATRYAVDIFTPGSPTWPP